MADSVFVSPGLSNTPVDASYAVIAANPILTSERILAGTAGQIILADSGANGNLTFSVGTNIPKLNVANIFTAFQTVVGLHSDLTTPSPLVDGDWWVDVTGTTPNRIAAIKVRDGGVTRTIASLTF